MLQYILENNIDKRERNLQMNYTKPIQVYRGEFVESAHDVHVAVVHANGDLIAYYGNPFRQTFARSSMKPFQVISVVESGAIEKYQIEDRELSLFCASHSAEPYHREAVSNILRKIQLEVDHLQCGTHVPMDFESYKQLIREGRELTPLYSNCSGKHSGMLTACVMQGFDVESYREVSHPYQQQIIDNIANITGYARDKIKTSVDGCGVPVHRLPLYYTALGFARLAAPEHWEQGSEQRKDSLRRVRDAMTTHPEMVAGTKRYDTDLMTAFKGRIVSKSGAEGVHCYGDRETGIGVIVKVEDGQGRASSVASMEVLQQLQIGNPTIWEQLKDYHHVPVLNARDEAIGKVVPNFKLKRL